MVTREILNKVVTEGGVEKRVPMARVVVDLAGKIIVQVGLLEEKRMKEKGSSKSVKRDLDMRLAQARPVRTARCNTCNNFHSAFVACMGSRARAENMVDQTSEDETHKRSKDQAM